MSDDTDQNPAAEPAPAPVSRFSELGALYDKIESADPSIPTEPAAPSAEDEPPPSERPRGPDGKFIRAEDAAQAAPATPVPDPGKTAPAEPAPQPAIAPPQSWSADAKAKWTTLAPEVQQYLVQREADLQKGFEQSAAKLKDFEPLSAVLEPVRQRLAFQGVAPAQYIQQLVAADEALRTQPAKALQWIAQTYGIDLRQLTQPAETPAEPDDPHIAALKQQLQSVTGYLAQQEAARKQVEQAQLTSQIEAFKADPKHPHFEDVRQHMAALMQAGQAKDLQDAYDQAVWANPAVRAKLLAEQTAEAERKRAEEAKKKAVEAQRISATNLSARGAVAGSPVKPGRMIDTITETANRLMAN